MISSPLWDASEALRSIAVTDLVLRFWVCHEGRRSLCGLGWVVLGPELGCLLGAVEGMIDSGGDFSWESEGFKLVFPKYFCIEFGATGAARFSFVSVTPGLARHFVRRFAAEQGKDIKDFSSEAMRFLLDYSWPGNVRELENTIEHAAVLAKGDRIDATDLPSALYQAGTTASVENQSTILDSEKQLLRDVLEECDWNKKEAARRLGISRSALYGKLRRYQIEKPTLH